MEAIVDMGGIVVGEEQSGDDQGDEDDWKLGRVNAIILQGTRVDDRWIKRLRAFPDLEGLDLSDTKITDRALEIVKEFRHLQWLRLSNTRVTEAGVRRLAVIATLNHLELAETNISKDALTSIRASLPSCQITLERKTP